MSRMIFAALLAVLLCTSAAAQEQKEWKRPDGLPDGNEVGVRYGVQVGVGGGPGEMDMQYVALDYARYNYHNIGFRTGLNYFVTTIGPGQYISVPMQFTWRSGRLVNKNAGQDSPGYYYDHQFYPNEDYGNPSTTLSNIVLSRLPSIVELHVGVTPGILFGELGVASGGFLIDRRFTCTADIGGRLNLPIRRFRIFVDITYHYYLTRNFRTVVPQQSARRSFVGIGGGVSVNF